MTIPWKPPTQFREFGDAGRPEVRIFSEERVSDLRLSAVVIMFLYYPR
jgi:hypothetical protein